MTIITKSNAYVYILKGVTERSDKDRDLKQALSAWHVHVGCLTALDSSWYSRKCGNIHLL